MKFKVKVNIAKLKEFVNSFDGNVIEVELESRYVKDKTDLNSELSYDELLRFFNEKIEVLEENI